MALVQAHGVNRKHWKRHHQRSRGKSADTEAEAAKANPPPVRSKLHTLLLAECSLLSARALSQLSTIPSLVSPLFGTPHPPSSFQLSLFPRSTLQTRLNIGSCSQVTEAAVLKLGQYLGSLQEVRHLALLLPEILVRLTSPIRTVDAELLAHQ